MTPAVLRFAVLTILYFSIVDGYAQSFAATVVTVVDGNTLEIESVDGDLHRIVLKDIDCPEPGQPYADEARQLLEKLAGGKKITVSFSGKNRKGNYLAVVIVDKGNLDPRLRLLREGLAWTSEKDPDPFLEQLRIEAHAKRRGLWQDEKPTAPWIYRREQSMMQAKSS